MKYLKNILKQFSQLPIELPHKTEKILNSLKMSIVFIEFFGELFTTLWLIKHCKMEFLRGKRESQEEIRNKKGFWCALQFKWALSDSLCLLPFFKNFSPKQTYKTNSRMFAIFCFLLCFKCLRYLKASFFFSFHSFFVAEINVICVEKEWDGVIKKWPRFEIVK